MSVDIFIVLPSNIQLKLDLSYFSNLHTLLSDSNTPLSDSNTPRVPEKRRSNFGKENHFCKKYNKILLQLAHRYNPENMSLINVVLFAKMRDLDLSIHRLKTVRLKPPGVIG